MLSKANALDLELMLLYHTKKRPAVPKSSFADSYTEYLCGLKRVGSSIAGEGWWPAEMGKLLSKSNFRCFGPFNWSK